MTPVPLAELRLSPKHHLSALWWLALMYQQPLRVRDASVKLKLRSQRKAAVCLVAHLLPYLLLLTLATRYVLFGSLRIPTQEPMSLVGHLGVIALYLGAGLACCLAAGLALGIAGLFPVLPLASSVAIPTGCIVGMSVGNAQVMVVGFAGGVGAGIALGIIAGSIMGLTAGTGLDEALRTAPALGIVAVLAIALGSIFRTTSGFVDIFALRFWVSYGLTFSLAGVLTFTRIFYLPIHLLLLWAQPNGHLYPYHPVAWDHLCGARFFGLHRLLVNYAQTFPRRGAEEIERISDAYLAQRFEALKAKVTLMSRKARKVKNLARLPEICAQLPEGEKGFLFQTVELKAKIAEIAAIQARLDAMDRPFLRGPTTENLVEKIKTFRDQISGFREPLASEFRAAAKNWLQIATDQRDRAHKVLEREPTAQVFRAGDPVDRDREAFVPRFPIFGSLEQQVMLATGCPGILLYGRRRTGKSTVLKNLPGFLPPNVRVVSVSMQNPEASSSHALFARHVTEAVGEAVPKSHRQEAPQDLPGLYRFLNALNSHLDERAERLLLGVDEFENIDRKIQESVFTEDLLDTLRELIQSHRQITWVFSGSHSIDELDGAEWASYLVSARTVEVPPFTFEETRLLLTEPLKHSRLWDKDDPARPRFSPEMWGEGGIKRIQAETGGWPHLVQLVAETLVDRMNDAGKGHVDEELFGRSLDAAVVAGDTVLSQLLRGESRVPGEWEYLLGFRERETQAPPEDDEVRRSLQRRLVVVKEGEGEEWRLRAPLFRRWLRKRG